MSERKWKSGANGCWWAVVPRKRDAVYPLPWLIGATRSLAWAAWFADGREGHATNGWKCVRVFITEAK